MHARRALDCLVDWYLERDLISYCRPGSFNAEQRASFLVSRGIIDSLSSRVLARAISKRNHVEHDYVLPSLTTAEDCVELWRRTMSAIRFQSDPSAAPYIFGIVPGGMFGSDKGVRAEFYGWDEPVVVLWRFGNRPWVGVVTPDDNINATVRRSFLDETSPEIMIKILSALERNYGRTSGMADPKSSEVFGRAMALYEN